MIRLALVAGLLAVCAPAVVRAQAADPFDSARVAAAREALFDSHGNQVNWLVLGERFEYLSSDDDSQVVWEAQGWVGRDVDKLWIKTEGEYLPEDALFPEAELQALYSRAIHSFWDVQIGLRHDFRPEPSRTYLAAGIQGLAQYWFEVDAALFLGTEGSLLARLKAEYDLRLTQRLILQPRLEVNGVFGADEELAREPGVERAAFGLRLRYEFRREFAPFIGINWARGYGGGADEPGGRGLLAGLRFWF